MRNISGKVFQRIKKYFANKQYLQLLPPPPIEVLVSEWPEFYNVGAKKKVLYLAAKYDYADKSRGISYEEYNFFYTLKNMGNVEVVRLDIYSIYQRYGKEVANKVIKEVAVLEGVDSILTLLYVDIFDHDLLKELSDNFNIDTILWLFDDDKRHLETKELVQCFNKTVTTLDIRHEERLSKGINSLLAQFAANHFLYKKYNVEKTIDVSFIGQNFGDREEYIKFLRANGIAVEVFGAGWSEGQRLSQIEMIETLNRSKIALNFSSSQGNPDLKFLKGRIFEIPATGTMLLTEQCGGLSDFFEVGEHLEEFHDKYELLEKIRFYLKHDDKREFISNSGMNKVINDYTFEKYLNDVIFS